MPLTIRDATAAEADLVAWVQVEASRSGTPLGFWDLALPGADEPRLRLVAAVKKVGHFVSALNKALVRNGWSEAHLRLLGQRIVPAVSCFSDSPDDRWIVEWVALRPEARGKGVASALLDAILERGRATGFRKAQITYLAGNTPARRTYERAGFAEIDAKHDPHFEAIFGAPGTVRMWLDL